jgi:hypothetical protein
VNAASGNFKNGSATVTVEQLGSSPLNQVAQAVTLGWVR